MGSNVRVIQVESKNLAWMQFFFLKKPKSENLGDSHMAGEQYDTWRSLPPIDMKSRRLSINNERRYERLASTKQLTWNFLHIYLNMSQT